MAPVASSRKMLAKTQGGAANCLANDLEDFVSPHENRGPSEPSCTFLPSEGLLVSRSKPSLPTILKRLDGGGSYRGLEPGAIVD
ncbi:MAG: hypothetical protein Q9213_000139 [Squamulea squamosa]